MILGRRAGFSYLVMFQGSATVVLNLLPEESHHVALYGGLQGTLRSLGLVNNRHGELGRVLARFVPDDESVGALVTLRDGVEDNLGVALQVGDRYTLPILDEVVATVPGHLRSWFAKDWNIKFQSVLGVHLDVSEGLGVNVGEH